MMDRGLLRSLKLDPFLLAMVGVLMVATLLPAQGWGATLVSGLSDIAIAALFFFHGAKLSRQAVLAGIRAWPVHTAVVLATFVMFPLLGVGVRHLADLWLDPAIGAGIVLLCIMPSTVQSSIAFTSMAGGNVPAAVTSASASSILGVFLTPMLAALLLSGSQAGSASWSSVYKIALQLLVPFVIGHALRPLLVGFLDRRRTLLTKLDRGVILLVVYTVFSAAVVEGLWHRYTQFDLLWTLAIDATLLGLALLATTLGARLLQFTREDEIAVVFCGSKKSLVSGVPMAAALFPVAQLGALILPLMLFHQLQLMACAVLAQRYAGGARAQMACQDVSAPVESLRR